MRPSDSDPVEISTHRHAVVVAVQEPHRIGGHWTYLVGHPGMPRRYGPFSDGQLIRGWDVP